MNRIKLLFSSIWDFIWPAVKVYLTAMGPHLADAAFRAVKYTAQYLADEEGIAKREVAYGMIVEDLKLMGIEAGKQVLKHHIYGAIEIAVAKDRKSVV